MASSARVSLVSLAEQRRRPPAWARGRQPGWGFWYFANRFGEPWVARRAGDELLVTGAEIGWQELRLTALQAETYLAELRVAATAGQVDLAGRYRLGLDEALWLSAVISAAFVPLSALEGRSRQPGRKSRP